MKQSPIGIQYGVMGILLDAVGNEHETFFVLVGVKHVCGIDEGWGIANHFLRSINKE